MTNVTPSMDRCAMRLTEPDVRAGFGCVNEPPRISRHVHRFSCITGPSVRLQPHLFGGEDAANSHLGMAHAGRSLWWLHPRFLSPRMLLSAALRNCQALEEIGP
jgi:hypothetical protein